MPGVGDNSVLLVVIGISNGTGTSTGRQRVTKQRIWLALHGRCRQWVKNGPWLQKKVGRRESGTWALLEDEYCACCGENNQAVERVNPGLPNPSTTMFRTPALSTTRYMQGSGYEQSGAATWSCAARLANLSRPGQARPDSPIQEEATGGGCTWHQAPAALLCLGRRAGAGAGAGAGRQGLDEPIMTCPAERNNLRRREG